MEVLTYKLIYFLNAIIFLCLGAFFSLRWFALRRRKAEPFLIIVFTILSVAYLLHALTFAFQSSAALIGALWIEFIVAASGMMFLGIVMGKEGIFPFCWIYRLYTKIGMYLENRRFRKNLKKVTPKD